MTVITYSPVTWLSYAVMWVVAIVLAPGYRLEIGLSSLFIAIWLYLIHRDSKTFDDQKATYRGGLKQYRRGFSERRRARR